MCNAVSTCRLLYLCDKEERRRFLIAEMEERRAESKTMCAESQRLRLLSDVCCVFHHLTQSQTLLCILDFKTVTECLCMRDGVYVIPLLNICWGFLLNIIQIFIFLMVRK